MRQYVQALEDHGITQSMSRKGNCLEDAVIKNLNQNYITCKDYRMSHFKQELENYIEYYNHKWIKAKLIGLSPVQYRTQSLGAA